MAIRKPDLIVTYAKRHWWKVLPWVTLTKANNGRILELLIGRYGLQWMWTRESQSCVGEKCPKPHCPVCGECDQIQWVPCVECHGYGTIECICEGVGGEYICGYGCDELAA